jgi:hypothetical protein
MFTADMDEAIRSSQLISVIQPKRLDGVMVSLCLSRQINWMPIVRNIAPIHIEEMEKPSTLSLHFRQREGRRLWGIRPNWLG